MFTKSFLSGVIAACLSFLACGPAAAQFVHPGCLSTQADLDRMKAKVDTSQQPWKGGYERLKAAPYGQLGHTPSPQPILYASGSQPDNYINLARDVAAAYQVALRYHVSGDEAYAAKAVSILMAWANTHTSWNGNTNVSLRAGLYGYQLACAGELVRHYSGWAPADFAKFQSYVRTQFYKIVSPNDVDRGFLFHHHGTCGSHYWANWDLAAMATVIATGVLCDDQAIFQEGIDYFYNGFGVGRITELLHYLHPNGLGQSQEFGRDQGHATMLVPLLGTFCEIAWNQGVDLYSELDNAFLAMSENSAKYNLWYDTPYVPYINCDYLVVTNIGTPARGTTRAGADMLYNHFVNRRGLAAPYTKEAAESIRPEGGGGQYGTNSGGFDQLGFTTLTHTLDPIASGATPSQLRAHVKGGKVTLSWRGSAYADSYNVKRATTPGGPYAIIATADRKNTYYVDPNRTPGTTYYYVVSANNPNGESGHSAEISATHDGQLQGTLIGTTGSAGNWGATRELAMDGSLKNYMDAWAPDGGWVGLDLGAGVSAVITAVKYCPRSAADTTVGGKFQGSNTADFSSGVVDLFTVTTAPAGGVFTTQAISNGNAFRYVRFKAPTNSYCTLAEVQFIGDVTGMTAPAGAPSGLAVTSPGAGQAALTWNSVSGATDYVIKRATTPGGPYTVVEYNNQWDTDYTDRNLPGGTYYYVVSALNSAGEAANSGEQSIVLPIQVSANSAPIIDGADIHHLPGGIEEAATIDGDGGNSGANDESTYVTAGRSSKGQTFTTGANSTGYTLRSFTFQHVNWPTWVNNGTFYDIQYGDSFEFQFGTMSGTAKTPLRTGVAQYFGGAITGSGTNGTGVYLTVDLSGAGLPSLAPNTTYYFEIASESGDPYIELNSTGVSGYAGGTAYRGDTSDGGTIGSGVNTLAGDFAFHADIREVAPAAPTGLSAAAANHNRIDLTWTTSPSATGYAIKRAATSGGPYTTVANPTGTSYSDTGLTGATTYYYVVCAINGGGESVNSTEAGATTPAPPLARLHLRFDEQNGTIATDSTGAGWDGTLVNDPLRLPGPVNNALKFDGTDDHVTFAPGVLQGLTDFTIATWVKWDGTTQNWQRIFDFGTGDANYMFLTPRNSVTGVIRYAITTNGYASEQFIDGTASLPNGVWTHVAVTRSGSTGKLYVNGAEVGSISGMTLTPTHLGNTNKNYLGRSQFASDPRFNGSLDEFLIFSRALDPSEIQELAVPPAIPTNLAASPGAALVLLEWNAVSGATGYNVLRSTTSGGPYTRLAAGLSSPSFSDATTAVGSTYHYVVTAVRGLAESPWSNEVAATPLTPLESWRLAHFDTTANSGNAADSADPDGDGWSNAQEFASGTDPNNRSSTLRIAQMQASGGDLVVSFATVSGKTYRVERSDTLESGSWTTVQDDIAGTGGTVQVTDPGGAAQPKRFYRITVR